MLTLPNLLGIDAHTLNERVWDQRPHLNRAGGGPVRSRFGAQNVRDGIEARPIPVERVMVRSFMGREDVASAEGTNIDPERTVRRVYTEDHALLISAAHTVFDEVAQMARELENDRRCLVRSNIFRSVLGTFAFPLHWDSHSLVAIQLEGSKRWNLFAPVHHRPLMGHNLGAVDAPELDIASPTMVVELHPGDVLYVPRGWGHQVCTTGDVSVHITFGFHKPTQHDLVTLAVQNVLAELEGDVESRCFVTETDADLEKLVQTKLSAALRTARAFYTDAEQRLSAMASAGEYTLNQRHFFVVREPVFGRARVGLGMMRQDEATNVYLSLGAAALLDEFNRCPGWTAGDLAEKSERDLKLVERDLLEMVQKGLLRAPVPEVSHARAELV
jgi:hypothetical protein